VKQEAPDYLSRFSLVNFHYALECSVFGPCGLLISLFALVGPSNDHELEIAREVDRLSQRGVLFADVVPELLTLLDFRISSTDYEFLKLYIRWRIDHPIVK
jgi:hypothetical protein